jgi:hypothetical protein
MTGISRIRRYWWAATILAGLAIAGFVGTPFLLTHHHHSDFSQNQHCAICAFASAHATPPATPQAFDLPLVFVTLVPGVPEQPLADAYVYTHDQRGPPGA